MKSNPRYVIRRSRTREAWWIVDTQDRLGDVECRSRREARTKCREMNATSTSMLATAEQHLKGQL